jgi:HD-GYP domain-containing protein (c-di-GMP phosphodiesterase class II)
MRLAGLGVEIGKRLGYSHDELLQLAVAALFHDNSLSAYDHEKI